MSVEEMPVRQRVEVPTDPGTAFQLWTAGINEWWKRGSHYWNDGKRALGLRFEPGVGGRFIEVYDEATGEGMEIGRIRIWEPGKRLVYSWREAGWQAGEMTEVEVLFESVGSGQDTGHRHALWVGDDPGSGTESPAARGIRVRAERAARMVPGGQWRGSHQTANVESFW